MRRFTAFLSFGLALALGSVAALPAQEWVLGPHIDLPDLEYNVTLGSVGLQDGTVLIAAEARTDPFPALDVELHLFKVDPDNGSVALRWSRPVGLDRPIRMVPTGDHVLLFENILDRSVGLDPQLVGVLQDTSQGNDVGLPFRLDSPEVEADPEFFDVTRLQDGSLVAVWRGPGAPGGSTGRIFFQRFDDQGTLIGPTETAASVRPAQVRVMGTADGGFLVAWLSSPINSSVLGRRFDSEGVAQGPIQELVSQDESAGSFDIASFPDGNLFVVWSTFDGVTTPQLLGRRIDAQGQPFAETLNVAPISDVSKSNEQAVSDRFGRIWITWSTSDNQVWVRQVQSDGVLSTLVPIPPRGLGNQVSRPQLTVDENGRGLLVWREVSFQGEVNRTLQARTVEIDNSCMEGDTMLCLHQGRFQVEVDWTDHAGDIGQGRVVPFQSSDSGLFWFFDEANWEVMVKVIDGCNFNGFYWIFSAATTDVAYDLKVTDTVTGLEQVYSNPLGEPAPANTDTMALMSCDHGPP